MANECDYGDNAEQHVSQELTSEDKRYAEEYLNETDETRENGIMEIRRWIEEELRIRIDDFLILRFLRVCEFNIEETKTRIRNYYKQRSDLPEWYMEKDPFRPELQELLDMGIFLPLRKPDNQRRLVIIIRGTLHDPRRHKISDIIKIGSMLTEVAVKYYPAVSVYGCTPFTDVDNPTVRQMFQLRPNLIMNYVHLVQNCYPIRQEIINIFNVSAVFERIIKIAKSFMNEKLKKKLQIYSNSLHCFKDIPVEILPVEYGGTDETCQKLTEYWKKLVEENRDWLMHDDENNRIE